MANENNYIGVAMGLDVSDLKAGVAEANKQIQLANSKFKAAASEMDDWTKSTDGLTAKIEQLDTVLDMQKKKLSGLEAEYAKVAKEQGENSEAARKLQVQIYNQQSAVNKTQRELNNYRETLQGVEEGTVDLEQVSIRGGKAIEKAGKQTEEAGERAEEASGGFTIMKGAIASLVADGINALVGSVKNGVSALMNLSAETQEYREDIGKLKTAWESAGKTTEQATAIYKEFYSVLGEEDRSVEAVNHLAKFVDAEEDMVKWTNIAAGVWGTFGDSLPIEGLTEASNESIKTGAVTGVLADALNWAAKSGETFGVQLKENTEANEEWNKAVSEATSAEEFFNLALQECTTEQERQALITDTLNGLYSEAAENYKKNNKSVIEARKATSAYNDEMAELGEAMEPVNANLTDLKSSLAKGLAPVVKKQIIPAFREFTNELKESDTIDKFSDSVGDIAEKALPLLAKGMKFVVENGKTLITTVGTAATVFATFNATMSVANTVTATTKAVKGLTTGVGLATKAQTVWNAVMSANPIGAVLTAVGLLTAGVVALAVANKNAAKETDLLSESQRDVVDSAEDAAKQYKDTKKAAEELASAENANIGYTKTLVKELASLADADGKVKEGYEGRAQFILTQLNEALGTEYTMNGNIIEQYGEMIKSINDVIEAKRAQILLSTYEETYRQAIENVAEAEKARAIQAQELAMQQEVYAEAERKAQEARLALNEKVANAKTEADLRSLSAEANYVYGLETNALKEKGILEDKQLAYSESEAALYQYYADIGNYEQAHTLLLEGETGEAIQLLNNLGSGFQTVASTAKLSAEEQKKVLEQQVIDTEVNAILMKEAYENGVEGVTEAMVKTAEEQAELAKEEFKSVGGDISEGIAEGAEGKSWILNNSMTRLIGSAIAAARKAADSHSPSRKARKLIGLPIGEGAGLGVLDAIPEVKKNMRTFNDYIFENLGKTKSGLRVGVAHSGYAGTSSSPVTPVGTTIDARMTVNYNGTLSRKQLKQLENDNYTAIRTRLATEGAIKK